MKRLKESLLKLIEDASTIGLDGIYLKDAKDFLENNEFGLCFDTIITQIYENDIEIDDDFYALISMIGDLLNLNSENFIFMKELIKQ